MTLIAKKQKKQHSVGPIKHLTCSKHSNAGAAESDCPLVKRKCTTVDVKQPVSKATRCHRAVAKEHRVWPFMYHCVGEDWQHTICKSLGVHFYLKLFVTCYL